MGIKGILLDQINSLKRANQTPTKVQHVPLNKVGDYCKGEDGNHTLPIEYIDVPTLTIVDSGARIAITTKNI